MGSLEEARPCLKGMAERYLLLGLDPMKVSLYLSCKREWFANDAQELERLNFFSPSREMPPVLASCC